MQAACSGATDLVTLLLKNGADPFATDRYGRNVIQQAAVMHRESVVRASA
jgi:ankyrin repeat protein